MQLAQGPISETSFLSSASTASVRGRATAVSGRGLLYLLVCVCALKGDLKRSSNFRAPSRQRWPADKPANLRDDLSRLGVNCIRQGPGQPKMARQQCRLLARQFERRVFSARRHLHPVGDAPPRSRDAGCCICWCVVCVWRLWPKMARQQRHVLGIARQSQGRVFSARRQLYPLAFFAGAVGSGPDLRDEFSRLGVNCIR